MEYNFIEKENRIECILVVKKGVKFVGIAKTNPEDEHSPAVGKKIAMIRAQEKMFKSELKALKKQISNTEKAILECSISVDAIVSEYEKMIYLRDKIRDRKKRLEKM